MSITSVGKNKWRVQVENGFNAETGKRSRSVRIVNGSKKQAEQVEAALMVKTGSPTHQRMTLHQFWESLYLPDCQKRLVPSTVHGYEDKYNNHIRDDLGGYYLDKITPAVVSSWLNEIHGKSLKFESFKMLRQILNKAVRFDLIENNPCKRVEPPKQPAEYEPDILPAEYVNAYLEAFRGARIEPAVLVALGGGLRRSEIVALNWRDYDGTSVTIDDAITSVSGKAIKGDTKSKFSKRRVFLPPSICARLDELQERGAMVKNSDGKRINPDNLTHAYEKVLRKLPPEVPRISLKNLRHTSLSLAMKGGAELLTVSRRAGHSTIAITARYYLRPDPSVDIAAAAGLDSVFSASKPVENA